MTRVGSHGKLTGRRAVTLPPNGLERIRELAAKGKSQEGISYALGMARDGIQKLKARDKTGEIERALFEGREREEESLVSTLVKKATEGTGKDSVIAAIFLLKTRHHYVEPREPFPVGPSVNIEIRVPGSLKPEDYAKLIQQVAPDGKRSPLLQAPLDQQPDDGADG